MLTGKPGNPEIETRKINKNDHIGGIGGNIFPAKIQIPKNLPDIKHYLEETHKCHVPVMHNKVCACRFHVISTPCPYIGIRIFLFQRADKISTMKVARPFAGNDIIFHCLIASFVFGKAGRRFIKFQIIELRPVPAGRMDLRR